MAYESQGADLMAHKARLMQQSAAGMTGGESARADLSSLRGTLQNLVERAQCVAGSVHSLADNIIGARPENASGAVAPQSIQPSLAELVEDLGRAISRAESGLNRF